MRLRRSEDAGTVVCVVCIVLIGCLPASAVRCGVFAKVLTCVVTSAPLALRTALDAVGPRSHAGGRTLRSGRGNLSGALIPLFPTGGGRDGATLTRDDLQELLQQLVVIRRPHGLQTAGRAVGVGGRGR